MSRRWRVLGLILGVIVKMRAILNKVNKSREKMKLYCCLFPNEYEFERETLVRLWMAMGFSSQSCAENFCERYFDILLKEHYIVISSVDTVTRRNLYKVDHQGKDNMGEKKTTNRGDLYTVLEDEDANGSKLGHISVVSNCINETTFKKLRNFDGELRTLLFIHNYGSTLNKIPSDLFLTLEFLRALDLSGNDIVELPRSIGNVSQLRYLDLSFTLIESLPGSIDQLHQLQTLKLQGCTHLHELPRGIIELICLRHLDLDVLGQLTSLPKGIGALTELCTLSAFIVESDEGSTIRELKCLNKLRGSFCISGLENVTNVGDVLEAALQDKKYLTHLQLRWSDLILYSTEDKQLGYKIISSLNLNKGLQDLQIICYPGLHIPTWVNFREQQNLVSITLLNCNNNDLSLPLGQLPNLKYLTIIHMNRVTKIDNWFHGGGDEAYVAFPKLESLKIECMLSLETWMDVCNHDDFPFLSTLIIKQCPKLTRLPFLSNFQVLKFFEISHCTEFNCLPEGTLPASLETLIIDDCPFLKKGCSKKGEDWHKVKHIPNIWIDLRNICSTPEDGGFEDSSSKSEDICSTDEDISEDIYLSAEDISSPDEDVSEDINPFFEGFEDINLSAGNTMAADLGISIVGKLLETLGSEIVKEVCKMWNYKSEREKLEKTVSTIRDVLLDADAKRDRLINNLKDAVYDADDLFDELHTLAELNQLTKPLSKRHKLFHKLRRFFSSENKCDQGYRMSRDVKEIKMRLDDIADCRNKFGFSVDNGSISRRRQDTCSYVEAKDIVGREKDKEAIIDKLLKDDENICCVTIVGVGGLGKTSLAQLVYNDEKVKKEFSDLRLWVCVSDQDGAAFDVKTILCKILEQVPNKKFDGISTMQSVHNHFQEQLRGKKYLIVLDDVWNEDRKKWLSLEKFLMLGQGGSRIIVTTRSERTGTIIGEKNMYRLDGLSEENSWLLFEMSAFNKEDKHENHHEFVEIGLKLLKKCYNIPLAIKVVGSLLYGQELIKWRLFEDSGLSKIGKGDNEILSILKLSYHNLVPSLKFCFSYCALFPKDYELKKETLISLWMAQGYIMPLDGGQCIEDAAEEHFVILLRRCFFQDVLKNEYEDIESVKIHDLMHDVAQEVGSEEIQAVPTITNNVGDKIRHVRCVGGCLQESLLCTTKIRSLSILDCQIDLVVTQIANWKCLRVLDLQESAVEKLPDSIGELIHLRYLNLSYNHDLEVLPDAITRLHNLQTLVLYNCHIEELPKDFCKLVKLRHLDLTANGSLNMPSGMDKLMRLKVLPLFVVGQKVSSEAQTYDELKPLKALIGIRGEIEIRIGEYYKGMDDMEGAYLKGMKHLAKVEIVFDDKEGGWDNQECERVMETLEPPSNVKVLRIQSYHGTIIPKWGRGVDDWAIFLSHLAKIELRSCTNLQEIPVLSKLPRLKSLHLFGLDNIEYLETSNGSQASEVELFFPSLVELEIWGMKKLKGWWEGVDDNDYHRLNTTPLIFTRLSVLVIMGCPELTSFPPCPSLKSLELVRNNEGLQIIVGTRGKRDENEVNTPFTAKLRQLRTDNLSHLKSLPINCLTELFIEGRSEAKFETAANQESLPEEFQRCASSLQRLSISKMNNVVRRLFGGSGLQHFTTLESLRFSSVTFGIKDEEDEDEDGVNSLFWKSIPQNIRKLYLRFLRDVTSLPKGMQYLTSLQTLRLYHCDKLKSLPDWIDRLSSLQSLDILSCKALQSLPDSMQNLTSLQRLEIGYCSDELIKRCKEPDGECCPHIRHIPHIVLIGSNFKDLSG